LLDLIFLSMSDAIGKNCFPDETMYSGAPSIPDTILSLLPKPPFAALSGVGLLCIHQ
jgi:hypothetical protein